MFLCSVYTPGVAQSQFVPVLLFSVSQKSQKEMNDATQGTLHQISESHEEIMTRQMALKSAQANVHSQIVANFRDLVREKSAIAAGNRELMEMAESIHRRLGAFASHGTVHSIYRCETDTERFIFICQLFLCRGSWQET